MGSTGPKPARCWISRVNTYDSRKRNRETDLLTHTVIVKDLAFVQEENLRSIHTGMETDLGTCNCAASAYRWEDTTGPWWPGCTPGNWLPHPCPQHQGQHRQDARSQLACLQSVPEGPAAGEPHRCSRPPTSTAPIPPETTSARSPQPSPRQHSLCPPGPQP